MIKIIGYDSDSVYVLPKRNKAQEEHFARLNAKDREAHVYLVDGEKVYFKIYRELHEIKGNAKYLGIGLEPATSIKNNMPKKGKIKSSGISKSYFKDGMKCCYYGDKLTFRTCTREHVIPKHKGGKIIKPCCAGCNAEKGGLMLHSYIQYLELSDKTERILIKIENAKKLLQHIQGG